MCRRVYVTPWCPACLTPGHPYKVETHYCWNRVRSSWPEMTTLIGPDREDDWRPPRANYVCDRRNRDLPPGRDEVTVEAGINSDGGVSLTLRLPGPEAVWINPDQCWNCLRRMLDQVDLQERLAREEREREKERERKRELRQNLPSGAQLQTESGVEQAVGGEASKRRS